MRKVLLALVLLATAFGCWLLLQKTKTVSVASEKNSPAAAAAALSAAWRSAPPAAVAIIESNFANVATPTLATPSFSPPPSGRPFAPEVTNMSPEIVLEIVNRAIHNYGQRFDGNPVGSNAEIARALGGDNPGQVNFLDPAMRVNEKGELVDAWGTPFFFHQISGTEMEIHSAGADKIMWTADDLVTR